MGEGMAGLLRVDLQLCIRTLFEFFGTSVILFAQEFRRFDELDMVGTVVWM